MIAGGTSCYTSRGVLGRKRTKARRHELRLARRRGALPCPRKLAAKYSDTKAAPATEDAAA